MNGLGKILVTGGAGFIGSHTAVALGEAGFEPVIVDNFCNSSLKVMGGLAKIFNQPVEYFEGDCNDADFMNHVFTASGSISGVIHFAAHKAVGESMQKPLKYYSNNINSLIILLESMINHNCSVFVFSSSATVYGEPEQLPVTESSPVRASESPYGNTKQIGEEMICDVVKSDAALRAMALRYFNPIGAHPSGFIGELPIGVPNNLVPFITQTAAGIREYLTVFGQDYQTSDGTAIRDYIHVMDLAEAHVATLKHLQSVHQKSFYDVINVGTGKGHTVREVIDTFEKVTGVSLNYKMGARRSGDVESMYAAVEKAGQILQWSAQRNLATGLKDAWNWQSQL